MVLFFSRSIDKLTWIELYAPKKKSYLILQFHIKCRKEQFSMEITLSCPQLQTTDYLDYDANDIFEDVVNRLRDKYSTEVIHYVQKFQNIRDKVQLEQVTIKLYYIDDQGIKRAVGLKTNVKSVVVKMEHPRIYWEPEPIGGQQDLKKNIW